MRKNIKRLSVFFALMLEFCTAVSVSADRIHSIIFVNQTSAQSETKTFSGSVGMVGINDQASTNNLYYEVYQDVSGVDPCIYSVLLSPGTGNMSTQSWYVITAGYNVGTSKNLYIVLNPEGLGGKYCYGAGQLGQ